MSGPASELIGGLKGVPNPAGKTTCDLFPSGALLYRSEDMRGETSTFW
jgi:hypothetical protein